jgi:Tol biopolymer transport system component
MDLDPTPSIQWSPDGTHISVVNDMDDGARLYVMDAGGSNVRLLADGAFDPLVAWSPDGARLAFAEAWQADGDVRILVAPMDGTDPAEIGSVAIDGCTYIYKCGLTWAPDGSTIGFHKDKSEDSAFAADGSGDAEPIGDLTYSSWNGGRYGGALRDASGTDRAGLTGLGRRRLHRMR